VPAFSNCSLDNSPGTGDPDAGEPWGQINGYLFWEYDSIVDESDKWAMTVYLVPSSPDDACTVDLTPRQCRRFKAKPVRLFLDHRIGRKRRLRLRRGRQARPGDIERADGDKAAPAPPS